jgi:L-fucose mutarotase
MLKGIHPLLSADLLHVLARMGHGDDLAIIDGNHPAETVARATTTGQLVRLPGIRVEDALKAVLTVFPLDDFTDDPVRFMEVVGDPAAIPPTIAAMQGVLRESGYAGRFVSIERYAYYESVKRSFSVVQCGDARFWGNVIVRMGAIEGI